MRWIAFVTRGAGLGLGSTVWAAARRRPAVAMIVAAVLVLLWPLCVDLFYAIPPPVRKAGGWVAFSRFARRVSRPIVAHRAGR